MFSRISTTSYYQDAQEDDYESRQQIDLLVDKFREASVRRHERDLETRKKKGRSGKSKKCHGPQKTRLEQGSSRPETCEGPTLRFMKKVFFTSLVRVSGRTNQQLPPYLEDEFVSKCLIWHNIFRSRHQAAPLRLSFPLCHEAQRLANQIAHTDRITFRNDPIESIGAFPLMAKDDRVLQQQSPSEYSQSLYIKYQPLLLVNSSMDVTAKEVVKHWYHRGALQYDHSLHPDILHTQGSAFSQLVWKSSTELGIGKARSIQNEAKVIVVALYAPRGNVAGQFLENVRPYVKTRPSPSSSDDELDEDLRDVTPEDISRRPSGLTKRLSAWSQRIEAMLH